jgi:phosphatidylglycerophosphate synthase
MFDNSARQAKEIVLTPLAGLLEPLHPNVMTLFSFALGMVAVGFAWQQAYLLAALFWALNRFTDGLDGTMARMQGRQSDFGGYLDIIADYIIYAALPVGLVLGLPTAENWLALTFLLLTYYVNSASWMYLSAILEKRKHGSIATGEKTTVTMPPAIIGGLETALIYFLFILWPSQLMWWYMAMGGLVVISIIQRLVWAGRRL